MSCFLQRITWSSLVFFWSKEWHFHCIQEKYIKVGSASYQFFTFSMAVGVHNEIMVAFTSENTSVLDAFPSVAETFPSTRGLWCCLLAFCCCFSLLGWHWGHWAFESQLCFHFSCLCICFAGRSWVLSPMGWYIPSVLTVFSHCKKDRIFSDFYFPDNLEKHDSKARQHTPSWWHAEVCNTTEFVFMLNTGYVAICCHQECPWL